MNKKRFYCENLASQTARLDADENHHLISVMRLAAGDEVELFDGKGQVAEAVITGFEKKEAVLRIKSIRTCTPGKFSIILAVSLPKNRRFDLLVEKCTELGADVIAAVHFERTVKKGNPDTLDRYRKIAVSACKQSGRSYLPVLAGLESLTKTIERFESQHPDALRIYGGLSEHSRSFIEFTERLKNFSGEIIVFIGPEGGITESEQKMLESKGAVEICINPHTLRVETAAVCFCGLLAAFKDSPA